MPALVQVSFQDGTQFTAFTSLEMREAFLDPFDSLSMTIGPLAHQVKGYRERLLPGELLSIYVDGRVQMFAAIQSVEQRLSPTGGVTFQVMAHTPAKILTEADPTPSLAKALSADAPLIDLMTEAVKPFGLGVMSYGYAFEALKARTGKSLSGVPAPQVKFKSSQPEPGESVFAMLNKHASRLGTVIRCAPTEPALYISVPHYETPAVATVRTAGDGSGPDGDWFFGDVSLSQSNEGQFSECVVYGSTEDEKAQSRACQPMATTRSADINSTRPPYRASKELSYKPAIFTDARATSAKIAKNVSQFFLGRAAREAFKSTGTVDGLVSKSGAPWTVDTMIRVYAPELGIDEDMWLSERTMSHGPDGQSTSLTLIPKGFLILGEYSTQ